MLGRLEAAHRHRRNLGQSGNAMVVVGPLAPTCAGIVGRIASVRANESRTGCWVRLTFTCGRRRLQELGCRMTAVRCTMSDTMYIGRTTGQLVRIALHSFGFARSAPVSPTGVHVCHLVWSKRGLVLHRTNRRNSDDVRKNQRSRTKRKRGKSKDTSGFHFPWIHHGRSLM